MLKISYSADGFVRPFERVNGTYDIEVQFPFLVWSAISVGRAELIHIFRYGEFSLFEIAYRAAIVYANLCKTNDGRIRRSEAYEGLDPSEKGAISYFLGMTVAKAFAARILRVPWLMHLDVYRQELSASVYDGQSRPDLVGQTTQGEWVCIETKGRTRQFDAKALQQARDQAKNLLTVNGQSVALHVGMVTHFDGDSNRLQFRAIDPPSGEGTDGVHLPLSPARFFEGYYRPFHTWLSNNPQARTIEMAGVTYLVAPVADVDVIVGLDLRRMSDFFAAGQGLDIQQADAEELLRSDHEKFYAGQDGVLVELGPSWSEVNMTREPQERSRSG